MYSQEIIESGQHERAKITGNNKGLGGKFVRIEKQVFALGTGEGQVQIGTHK